MKRGKLSPKKDAFCREIVKGLNPTEARRKVWKSSKCAKKSHHEAAYRLMKDVEVLARIEELRNLAVESTLKTREEYLRLLEDITFGDPVELVDEFNNPIDLRYLPQHIRYSIAAFEFSEDFLGVREGLHGEKRGVEAYDPRSEKRLSCGYTKKYKLVDRHKFAVTYGKMRGFIRDEPEPGPEDKAKQSLRVTFVSAQGKNIQVNLNPPTASPLVTTKTLQGEPLPAEAPASIAKRLGVRFVKPA